MIDALMLLGSLGAFLLLLLTIGRSRHSGSSLGLFAFKESPKAQDAPTTSAGKGAGKGPGHA